MGERPLRLKASTDRALLRQKGLSQQTLVAARCRKPMCPTAPTQCRQLGEGPTRRGRARVVTGLCLGPRDVPGAPVAGAPGTDRLSPPVDEVGHRRHVLGVARVREAAEVPAVLDSAQHRVMVVWGERSLRLVLGSGDHDREHMAAAGVGVTAAACVAKAEVGGRTGEVALVPGDEDHRVRSPRLRGT